MSQPDESDFTTVEDVLAVVGNMEDTGKLRACDRATIDNQFNGGRPYTPKEEEEHQIQVNANFLEGYKIAQDGILQSNSALLFKDQLIATKCLGGKVEKREGRGIQFAQNLNNAFKRGKSGKKFLYMMNNRNASFVLHGIGALLWANDFNAMPRFVALNDLLIPTDTPLDFSDELSQFGVNVWLTPWQLRKMTSAEKSAKGWNTEFANEIIKSLKTVKDYSPDLWNNPEEAESLWKQRALYMNSDAVSKVKLTYFYYQNPETGKWHRKIIVRENQALLSTPITDKFLYDGKDTPFADSIDQILHVQFGDGSVVAPRKYHEVRGLGVLLYSVIELMNRLRCQWTQHTFESLMTLVRVANPTDRDRPKMLQLQPYAVLEDGISFVPPEQRHQVDPNLVHGTMAEYRQLMQESSSSYKADIDTGSRKEQTLGEAQIKLQTANKMVAGTLQTAYSQEVFLYEEEVRRFLLKTSQDPEVKAFQAKCRADGIPDELMQPKHWQVEIVKVMGGGDATLAKQEAQWLLANSQRYDPTAQRIILRRATSTVLNDPEFANTVVPEKPVEATDGRMAAEEVFGTLMQGGQVVLREGFAQEDYVAAMLQLMAGKIDQVQPPEMGTPQDVIGLSTVGQDIEQHIQLLEGDPEKRQLVKMFSYGLGKLMNLVKAMIQRQTEQAQQQGDQQDPKAAAEIQTMLLKAQIEGAIKQQKNAEKLRADKLKLQLSETRKNIELMGKMEREKQAQAQELIFAQMDKAVEMANAETNGSGEEK